MTIFNNFPFWEYTELLKIPHKKERIIFAVRSTENTIKDFILYLRDIYFYVFDILFHKFT